MAINFGQYVYKPRPLQDWDIGKGFQDLIEQRQRDRQLGINQGQLSEQTAARGDLNTRFAAQMDEKLGDSKHKADVDRYTKTIKDIDAAHEAEQRQDWNTVEALRPSIIAGGGTVDVQDTEFGPKYTIRPPSMPTQSYSFGGSRKAIFGGPPSGGVMSPSFQMKSNVGPGDPPNVTRNPFERLDGSSAAALPPPQVPASPVAPPAAPPTLAPAPAEFEPPAPTAAEADLAALNAVDAEAGEPPPDDEVDSVTMPGTTPSPVDKVVPTEFPTDPESLERSDEEVLADPEVPEEEQSADQQELERNIRLHDARRAALGQSPPGEPVTHTAQSAPLQSSTGAYQPPEYNPPPADDPYTSNPERIQALNRFRLDPALKGIEDAMPIEIRGQMKRFREGVQALRLPPAETLKLLESYYGQIAATYRGQMQADAMGLRAEQGREDRLAGREQMRAEREAARIARNTQSGFNRAEAVVGKRDFKAINQQMNAAKSIGPLLDEATSDNSNAANAVVALIFSMQEKGIMTDSDFARNSSGGMYEDLWSKISRNAEQYIHSGMTITTANNIKAMVKIAIQNRQAEFRSIASGLWRMRNASKDEGVQAGIEEAMVGFFDPEYWPQEFQRTQGIESLYGTSAPPPYQAPARTPAPVGPMGPNGSYAGPGVRGSRVPEKPPRRPMPKKDPQDMTQEELEQEADRMNGGGR